MTDDVILRCEHLGKRFDATVAVNDMTFSVNRGDIFGLVGENGAGKSTLIKMLGGEYVPNAGKMWLKDTEVRWANSYQALGHGISIVHQHPLLVESFSAEENIFLGKEFLTKTRLVDEEELSVRAKTLCDEYSIYPSLDLKRRVDSLSAGEKQIVEILKSFSYDPEILILDEPTASLPKEEAGKLLELVRKLNRDKKLTIIYISHKLEETFSICNKIMVMRNGENVGILGKDDFDRARLIRMMMNHDLSDIYPPKSMKTGGVLLQVTGLHTSKLTDISLEVREGEIVGLYGLMEAGMGDIANALFGMEKITAGEILLPGAGKSYTAPTVEEMVKQGIYLVPEDRLKFGLIPSFNVRENTSLAHLKYRFPKLIINDRAEGKIVGEELEKLHVKYSNLEQGINELSGGNQQKVIVSRWLMKDCSVLIVNDPTVGIDIGAKRDIYILLRNLAAQGKGVLFVSSELNEIVGMTDRVYTMRHGTITAELTGESLNQQNILENIL